MHASLVAMGVDIYGVTTSHKEVQGSVYKGKAGFTVHMSFCMTKDRRIYAAGEVWPA